jgi:SWI/SNF-related matrix-associated actin-dependent regulator of chromatin subfamily A member 5
MGFSCVLADEMGLGKTIQAIGMIGFLKEYLDISRPILIVCPNSVVSNWNKELKKWLPSSKAEILYAWKEHREDILDNIVKKNNFDIIITSYEGVNICLKELKKINWSYLIVDEAHRLKNDQSLLSKNLRTLNTKSKLLLTGTPL